MDDAGDWGECLVRDRVGGFMRRGDQLTGMWDELQADGIAWVADQRCQSGWNGNGVARRDRVQHRAHLAIGETGGDQRFDVANYGWFGG